MSFEVGEKFTLISGPTAFFKDDLPKIGARWDDVARVWRMPSNRTDEFVSLCEAKQIEATEVFSSKPKEVTETLWSRDEGKRG